MKTCKRLISVLLYQWVGPLIALGRTKVLVPADMPPLPARLSPRLVDEAFWHLPLDRPWAFLGGILRLMRRRLVHMGALMGLSGLCGLCSPLLVHRLISLVGDGVAMPLAPALAAALGLCLTSLAEGLAFQHYVYGAVTSAQQIANGLNLRLYRQALALSRSARLKTPIGDVVNHMGTDTDQVGEFAWTVVELTYSVVMISAIMGLLFHYLGLAALAALGVLAAMAPLTRLLARRFTALDEQVMKHRDRRVSLISSVLSGIRIVKYFVWEERLLAEVRGARAQEVQIRRQLAVMRGMSLLIYVGANALVGVASFGTYVALGHQLDAPTVFACIGLFGLLEYPFGNLTNFISGFAEAKVSAGRIGAFLREERLPEAALPPSPPGLALGVEVDGVTGRYGDAVTDALVDLSFQLQPGEAVAVVGPVGSGKSSLLLALLGELPLTAGAVRFSGLPAGTVARTAYVSQEAFVQNGSLYDNVLFGATDVSIAQVSAALDASAMTRDIARLPGGAATEIGEHGVNLSGGQKQRLCLARAVVARPGLVLLDDPLAAVDSATEDVLVERCLFGALAGLTRVVVTHRLKHLTRFDRVLFVEGGRLVGAGTYGELLAGSPRFATFVAETIREEGMHAASPVEAAPVAAASDTVPHRITDDEDRETGAVKVRVYADYLRSLGGRAGWRGWAVVGAMVAATLGVTLLPILQTSWLAVWTDRLSGAGGSRAPLGALLAPLVGSERRNVAIYAATAILLMGGFFAQNLLWALRAVGAGQRLHDQALRATLAAPLRFFDATPVGRILNRFSRDVDSVERQLPWSFEQTTRAVFGTLGSLGVLLTVVPAMLLVTAPVVAVFFRLQRAYRATAREAQRLASISRSPRFAHFKETLSGLAVIRGFHRGDAFTEKFYQTLSEYQRMYHAQVIVNRWFSVRVPLIGAAVSLGVAVSVVFGARAGLMTAGTAGLVLAYALRFWAQLNWSVRAFSEVEARLTSVERLNHYGKLPPEPATTALPVLADEALWPTAGALEFRGVTARYAAHLPDVLKDVSFTVPAGTRVGLIGRTGSGKSTVFQVLFRFLEANAGAVLIDGRDIATIPLGRLRRSLAVIPQDPTLFKGTLRQNLDRFQQHDDAAIWTALSRTYLAGFITNLPGHLDAEVKENGMNFSQGQRQLLCLARALLVDARIIVMDEATASVDVETDALIQTAIRRECVGRTLLIIAHRLGTVFDCDLVVELADGRVERSFRPAAAREVVPDLYVVPALATAEAPQLGG